MNSAIGVQVPWTAAFVVGALMHVPALFITLSRPDPLDLEPLPVELELLPKPPDDVMVKDPEDRERAVPEPEEPVVEKPPPEEADDIAFDDKKDDAPPPPSNRPPEEETGEPVPVVTGINVPLYEGKAWMGVKVGNTTAPGFDRPDIAPGDVKGYSGGKVGGLAGLSGGRGDVGPGTGGGRGWRAARQADISTPARLLRRFRPRYPADLLKLNIDGMVVVDIEVTFEGKTRNVTLVKRAHPRLDRLAVLTVRRFTWAPAEIGGKPVDSVVRHTVRFEIVN